MSEKAVSNYKTKKKPSLWNNKIKESISGYLFLVPEFIGVFLLGIFPLFFSLYLSFTDWDLVSGLQSINFIGLENYRYLFQDPAFFLTLKNNLIFSAVYVPASIILALLIAIAISSAVYFRDFFKIAFFIPYISTMVAVASVFAVLFHPSLGVVNNFLMSIGIENPPGWFGSTDTALWGIIIISVWQVVGYNVVIYIAGITGISKELYESAQIDGAGKFKQFLYITVPQLGPTTFFLLITSIVNSFKVFDVIAFLTQGGPNNATNVLVYYIYEEGFQNFRMGYASALSWILFLIVAAITIVTAKSQKQQF
ncbi:carbohydrate ABC transporter permease [Gracilibacillus alcaliphilus]|uniref:carbohydrate ABC transporter permease n=1 Tax=Gracilibacillus alcaliphilus TaxID=1401441 RepID=UPI001EF82932|nr:sugar ABC transporter permease [Gracilibacillus alcaliphilus]MBM7678993.1 multiple sugar transport system permease protein [Gracilibacillus alcaliphilus]